MSEAPPGLFRPEALRHRLAVEEGGGLIQVGPPWTWALLVVLLAALASVVAAAWFGRVDVNGRGRGILRPRTGVRMLLAGVEGTVAAVEAQSGQPVLAGAVLVRIAAAPLQAQLLEAQSQLEAVRGQYALAAIRQDRAHAEQLRSLRGRRDRLREHLSCDQQALVLAERSLDRHLALEREGIVSPDRVDQGREGRARAQSQLHLTEQGLEQVAQEAAALASGREEQLWQRRQTIRQAEVRLESLALMLDQTVLAAPDAGQVEAMLVKPGERVRLGQALCKLIPQQAPLRVVAFLEEKDRAFLRPGDTVQLELDQLPYAEYGTVPARIERISDDLASAFEITEALGDNPFPNVPTFRVELAVAETRAADRAGVPLRSGMLMNARFTLRRQRLLTLVLEPLRKWLR